MADVFISYASADRERARVISERLSSLGHSVWWDRTIPPGRIFDEVIQEALAAAKCVVVLWSETSVRSNWVKTEASDGMARHRLVPALIDNVPPPMEFRRVQAANLTNWSGEPDHPEFAGLVQAVGRLVSAAPTDTAKSDHPAPSRAPATLPSAPASSTPARWGPRWVLGVIALVLVAGAVIYLAQRPREQGSQVTQAEQRRDTGPSDATSPGRTQLPTTSSPGAADAPRSVAGRMNLIAPENGGQMLAASSEGWAYVVDGKEDTGTWVDTGMAVFGFKDGRAATFDTFTMLIPDSAGTNVRDFELSSGNEGPTGRFEPIGKFSTQNVRMIKQPFQEFRFSPVTAKYFKIRTLKNHDGSEAVRAFEMQLLGKLD